MIMFGNCFGSAPAIYAASKHPKSHLILNNPFARMSDAISYPTFLSLQKIFIPLYRNFVESYYRYPNEDWIRKVKGEVLIIQSGEKRDKHIDRLLTALTKSMSKKESLEYYHTHVLVAPLGSLSPINSEEIQERLTSFIGTTF